MEKEGIGGLKFDQGKPRFDLIPPEAELAIARVLTMGAEKYGSNNWRGVENFKSRYYAAARRHLNSYWSGKSYDKESGQHHLAHAVVNLIFILTKEIQDHGNQSISADNNSNTSDTKPEQSGSRGPKINPT